MKAWTTVTLMVLVTAASIGCSSMQSTLLTRNESNTNWCTIKHLKGVPITLKVPTHLRVYIYQKHFLEQINVGGVTKWQLVEMPAIHDFSSETLYTDQIFTTDFKRPAAGAFNLDLDMTEDQYVERVQQDITDETLEQIGALIEKLPGLFVPAPVPGAKQASDTDAGVTLKEIKSVVAAGLFEVDAPDFEIQVESFVRCHLNGRNANCIDGFAATDHVSSMAVQPMPNATGDSATTGSQLVRMAPPKSTEQPIRTVRQQTRFAR